MKNTVPEPVGLTDSIVSNLGTVVHVQPIERGGLRATGLVSKWTEISTHIMC